LGVCRCWPLYAFRSHFDDITRSDGQGRALTPTPSHIHIHDPHPKASLSAPSWLNGITPNALLSFFFFLCAGLALSTPSISAAFYNKLNQSIKPRQKLCQSISFPHKNSRRSSGEKHPHSRAIILMKYKYK